MKENSEKVKQLILTAIPRIAHLECKCKEDINSSLI